MKKYIVVVFLVIVIVGIYIFISKSTNILTKTNSQKANIVANTIVASGSQDFNIIAVLPLSGRIQGYGEEIKDVLTMASEEINNSDRFTGKLNLQFVDGACSNDVASKNIAEQVDFDKVNVIIGGICQEEAEAINTFSLAQKIIYINIGQTSSSYIKNNILAINLLPVIEIQAELLSETAFKNNIKKIAILKDKSLYGEKIATNFESDFEYKGGEVSIDTIDLNTASAQVIQDKLSEFKKDRNTALLIALSDTDITKDILSAMRNIRWFAPLYLSNNLAQSIGDFGSKSKALDSSVSTRFDLSSTEDNFNLFNERFKSKYGREISKRDNAIIAYDAIYFIIDANQAVGVRNDALLDWMSSIKDWVGMSGPIIIDQNGYRVGSYSTVLVKGGRLDQIK